MNNVIADRITTHIDDPFVVFLIGMRVNQFWSFSDWMPIAGAFPKMLTELQQHPEKGFMGGHQYFSLAPLTTCMVSYWKSFDHLEHFARSKDDPHLGAWREFNQRVGFNGKVGIWHETYLIDPEKYEVVYGNMPLFGLAKATDNPIPVKAGAMMKARGRLTGKQAKLAPEIEFETPSVS